MKKNGHTINIFIIPVIIGILTSTGLIVALIGDGFPDRIAWLILSVPILAVVWAITYRNI